MIKLFEKKHMLQDQFFTILKIFFEIKMKCNLFMKKSNYKMNI